MKNLSKKANSILERVEFETGKGIQFLRDDELSVLATLQRATKVYLQPGAAGSMSRWASRKSRDIAKFDLRATI